MSARPPVDYPTCSEFEERRRREVSAAFWQGIVLGALCATVWWWLFRIIMRSVLG